MVYVAKVATGRRAHLHGAGRMLLCANVIGKELVAAHGLGCPRLSVRPCAP